VRTGRCSARAGRPAHDPVAAQLQVDQVALFQVDDLVGHAGQGHGVAGQKVLALAHAQDQRRAGARAHHAVRLVLVHHGNGVGAVQLGGGGAHGLEQVAVVQAVHQVGDDLGVGLAGKHIAARLQRGAQLSWFSMMPLCTRATRPARAVSAAPRPPWLKCGWALCTAGAPCVAQRVGDAGGAESSCAPAPAARPRAPCCARAAGRCCAHAGACTATPQES
jgi:hypothetical protein